MTVVGRPYPPFEPAQVVEDRMYEGFPTRADEGRMQAFHVAEWVERAEIAKTWKSIGIGNWRGVLYF